MSGNNSNQPDLTSAAHLCSQPSKIELVLIAKVAEFPPEARQVVEAGYEKVLVVNVEGEVWAVSDVCPHSGGYLHQGPIADYIIECPLHYWPFDLRTGELVGMPASYDERLNTYKVRQIDDELYLEIPLD